MIRMVKLGDIKVPIKTGLHCHRLHLSSVITINTRIFLSICFIFLEMPKPFPISLVTELEPSYHVRISPTKQETL
ncbi:Ankyrin Repeat And Btb/Poz Domain-Containing Protein Btbd11 [Manis pentadactyla]|nr:Ankyrin Repeat And Btb/Poz Domain-Containing Protein Btbd11 [Manis pentadactyla]